MAIKKLSLDDFYEDIGYTLIGIHTSLADYRLAYLLNTKLHIQLKRLKKDIDFINNATYSIFQWEDSKQLSTWDLVSNTCKVESTHTTPLDNNLFTNSGKTMETYHLLPELKKINYLLKINDPQFPKNKSLRIIQSIQEIPQIITAYLIEVDQLRSKNNLIFN